MSSDHIKNDLIEVKDINDFVKYVESKWKNIFFKSLIPFELLLNIKLKDISELAEFCVINSHYTKCLPGLQASLIDVLNKYKIHINKEDIENLEIISGYYELSLKHLKKGENIYKKKFIMENILEVEGENNYQKIKNTLVEIELIGLDLNKKYTFLNSWFHLT
jgi:hypothetical protein